MKKSIFTSLLFISFLGNVFSQIGNKDIIDTTFTIPNYQFKVSDYKDLLQGKSDKASDFLINLLTNDATINPAAKETARYIYKKMYQKKGKKLLSRRSIVFIENPLLQANSGGTTTYYDDTTSIKSFTLYGDKTMKQNKKNNYSLDEKYFLMVYIGHSATKVSNLNATRQPTYFSQTLKDAFSLVMAGGKSGGGTYTEEMPLVIVLLKKNKVRSPSTITFNVPYYKVDDTHSCAVDVTDGGGDKMTFSLPYSDKSQDLTYSFDGGTTSKKLSVKTPPPVLKKVFDSVKIKNHELNHFTVSIGIAGTYLNKNNFSLSGDTLNVKLDSAQKKIISSNLLIGIEYFPFGRDIDQFPLKGKPFYRWWSHLGVYGGVKLSSNPLQTTFFGVTLSLTKEISINAGYLWQYQSSQQTKVIPGINSVSDATAYINTTYKGTFSWGITISPSLAAKDIFSSSK